MDRINEPRVSEGVQKRVEFLTEANRSNEVLARRIAFLSPYLFWLTVAVLGTGILLVNLAG